MEFTVNIALYSSFLLIFLCGEIVGFNFTIGNEYHYEYKADSKALHDFRIRTVVKFRIQPIEKTEGNLTCILFVDSLTQSTKDQSQTNPAGWNFKRGFEFIIQDDGLIFEIAHHQEESHDVINLKKVLASVFSAKKKQQSGNEQELIHWEYDHSGYLQHKYEFKTTTQGHMVHKHHESTGDIYREHRKTLHYTQDGLIHYIKADDTVILQNKRKSRHLEMRHTVQGEREVKVETSGDVNDIQTMSTTDVRLVKEMKLNKISFTSPLDLKVKDSIVALKEKSKCTTLEDERNTIERNVVCIQTFKDKAYSNRTDCFANLVQTLGRLNDDGYEKLAITELSMKCNQSDVMCTSRVYIFIDLLVREGRDITQRLIINHFLKNNLGNESDLIRIFFHVPNMRNPTLDFVEAVEELCFGTNQINIGRIDINKTEKHACLALGSLMKTFIDNSSHKEKVNKVLALLQEWLRPHNQTHFKEVSGKRRPHRSVDGFDRELHNFTYSKMALIHALGNSGSSRDHILTYMRPGEGDNCWRRAAIQAMRHFNCVESSTALLNLIANDPHPIVKHQALDIFKKHPMARIFLPEHRDILISRNYTYHTLMRTKRGILDVQAQDGIFFSLVLPGIQWTKQIGNSALGASFGIVMNNELEIEIMPLSGHAMLNVHNDAFAKVELGWFGVEQYLFRAFTCFRGHAGYDINILKDFGINGVEDLVKIFDKITSTIVDPAINVIKAFTDIIHLSDNGIEYIVDKIIELVKNFPLILESIVDKVIKAVMKVIEFGGIPWIDQIKKIIIKARYFVEDIKEDITDFYKTIADAITVTLPYVAKKLFESVTVIITALKNFLSNPVQSISIFGKSVLDIKLAIGMFLDVKNKVLETLSFLKGGTPFWIDYWEDFKEILGDVKDLIKLLFEKTESQSSDDQENDLSTALTDGVKMAREEKNFFIKLIQDVFGKIITQFTETLGDLITPFFKAFYSVFNAVKMIKSGYSSVRDIFIKIKNIIQKIFGSKFHIKFPNRRRHADSSCGSGIWPTNQNGRFQTLGVDISVSEGSVIRCPVNGEVFRENNRIRILPTDDDFIDYEIIIENIIPNSTISTSGKFLNAGNDIIGKSGISHCDQNCIHVSVRKKSKVKMPDSDYEYIDPSPFLDRLLPDPQWHWDCKDYTYYNILSIVSADGTDEELQRSSAEIQEPAARGHKDMKSELPPVAANYQPPEFDVATPNGSVASAAWNKFKDGFKGLVSNFKDIAKQLFDFSRNRSEPNLLDLVNINKYTLGRLKELLGGKVASEMKIVFDKLQQLRSSITAQNLDGLSFSRLQSLLSASFSSATGAKSNMISKILSKTEYDCPAFQSRVSKGKGNVCFIKGNCDEISCAVLLSYANQRVMGTFTLKMDGCLKQITVTTKKEESVIEFENVEPLEVRVTLATLSTVMTAELVVSITFLWSTPLISLSAELCATEYIACISSVPVLENFELQHCSLDEENLLPDMDTVTVEDFIAELSDHHILDHETLKVLDTIRAAMMEMLINDPSILLKILGKEFGDKVDFCANVEVPFPVQDFVFVDSDKLPEVFIMVGPVPIFFEFGAAATVGLRIEVGLCILSYKANAQLTPWAGAKVWGGAYLKFFIFRAGMRVVGYLLETRFPITTEIHYNKFPLDVRGSLDISVRPLRLEVQAYLYMDIGFGIFKITLKIFKGTLFTISMNPITANIFTNLKDEKDSSPPEFSPPEIKGTESRHKRETTDRCFIRQVPGRNHKDPAYELEIAADDDKSSLKMFYAIGTQQGGTNVLEFTEMGGFSILVANNSLPNGIPLHWTVKAVNSQGSEAHVYCMLPTYDNTLPDGRVDPSYIYSSHPNTLSGTISVFEDSVLQKIHMHAVGFSSGMYGSEILSWKNLTLDSTTQRIEIENDLKHFSVPKDGRLTSKPFATNFTHTPQDCATQCLNAGTKCVSFDYDYFTEYCELQHVVEGPNAKLRVSGTYMNYERLGVGYTSFERYENLPLEHGNVYFINAGIENVLGYVGYLHSVGTLVDFTPPYTGPLGTDFQESVKADGCRASVAQRCVQVTWKENHRYIIDGKGASTVFNGHTPLVDELFTRSNHFISVNFDGFYDDESGIYQYQWAVGKSIGSHDVVNFSNPHEFLHSSKHWTNIGFATDLHLHDGEYFMTVQCLNNVVFGGSLVTTVSHRIPLTVDTTPPFLKGIKQIYFDENFDILGIYYEAGDNESLLASVDFGLGKTKYDVLVRAYSYHSPMNGNNHPFIVIEELDLKEGIPAWPRVRVDNGVDLFKAGNGPEPILIDRSAPEAGTVWDGNVIHLDLEYQSSDNEICAQWTGFYDPESGIYGFQWGIGTAPGDDNAMTFRNFSHNTRNMCAVIALQHNTTYYSTVVVFNAALNSKSANSTSNGVRVDVTPPVQGYAVDGLNLEADATFSSETATKSVSWDNFSDSESGIKEYFVSIYVNDAPVKTFGPTENTLMIDHSVSMEHNDRIRFEVESFNKAGLSVAVGTDGFSIDHTPPILVLIQDNVLGNKFQTDDSLLKLRWEFQDTESGIQEYRYSVFEKIHGLKKQIWPTTDPYLSIPPRLSKQTTEVDVTKQLVPGATYSVHVTAINQAQLFTSHESFGVTIDPSPPVMLRVHIGFPDEEEEIEDGFIQHPNSQSIRISWIGDDPESSIKRYFVALGTSKGDTSVTAGYIDMGTKISADIKTTLLAFIDSGNIYYAEVKAENGAGILSNPVSSNPIKILKGNKPGVIYDGRESSVDSDVTNDKFSIAMHFEGFEAEACNIVQYEWAIGTYPYFSDISDFTEHGLAHNETHGKGQIHIQMEENKKLYVTVRAKTGHGCHEEYIVSTSDGITSDFSPPEISNIFPLTNESQFYDAETDSIYLAYQDSLGFKWNIAEQSALQSITFSVGTHPSKHDIVNISLSLESTIPPGVFFPEVGKTFFINVYVEDDVGYLTSASSFPIVADISSPFINNFTCTDVISTKQSVVVCSWIPTEQESRLEQIAIQIGSRELFDDIVQATTLHTYQNTWTFDANYYTKVVNLSNIYVTLTAKNVLNKYSTNIYSIQIDSSAPEIENIDIITWTNPNDERVKQFCQLPWSYVDVEISGLDDNESGIERAEICLGSEPGFDNIKEYQELKGTYVTIDNIFASPGSKIYATVRAFNKVGLHNVVTSDYVIVSPDPTIEVFDGGTIYTDLDYQNDLNVIQGSFRFSDNCPVRKSEWSVEDLTGKIIQNYTEIPGNGVYFYNDQLILSNNFLYFVKVKIIDALNRTMVGVSDGITVKLQPPASGYVRDGLMSDDINFQESTTELSANWDPFGISSSNDPTQKIDHYELSIGDDTRDYTSRTNIHSFTNVGLNSSHIFTGLNLTSKSVRFFITVRGYSITGSFGESYSNGVRTGYSLDIIPGTIEVNEVQSSTTTITASWNDFESDIGINEYRVAVSTKPVIRSNLTFSCSDVRNFSSMFDVAPLESGGLNTLITFTNLTLDHGNNYFITVIASNEIGKCSASESHPILVDTSPPDQSGASFIINGVNVKYKKTLYVTDSNEMEIHVLDIIDPESKINIVIFRLHKFLGCPTSQQASSIIQEIAATNDPKVIMTHLKLETHTYYYIDAVASNYAGLKTYIKSPILLLDNSLPNAGSVKIGSAWTNETSYQSSTFQIEALTAIARTKKAYNCDNSLTFFPSYESDWTPLSVDFSSDNVFINGSYCELKIGYNVPLTKVLKSGVVRALGALQEGVYTSLLTAAHGTNVSTAFIISTSKETPYFPKTFTRPTPNNFEDIKFNFSKASDDSNGDTETATVNSNIPVAIKVNNTEKIGQDIETDMSYGFGFQVLGDQQQGSKVWDCLFSARDANGEVHRWIQVKKDPTKEVIRYSINTNKRDTDNKTIWDLEFSVEKEVKAKIYGLSFKTMNYYVFVQTWNLGDYEEPISDPIYPFRSQAKLMKLTIPANKTMDCMYGRGFYSSGAAFAEIWVGLSDNIINPGNIRKMELYEKMCVPCLSNCNFSCDTNCFRSDNSSLEFDVIPITIRNITLMPTVVSDNGLNASIKTEIINMTEYYLNVQMVTFSGQSVTTFSNPVIIDTTPPDCEYLYCLDPVISGMDAPVDELGSNNTIGAKWNCLDNISGIKKLSIKIGTAQRDNGNKEDENMYGETDVGLVSKISIKLKDGILFEDGRTYFVNLVVYNGAGLPAVFTCNVTTILSPPDVSNVQSGILYSSKNDFENDVVFIESLDRFGINWENNNHDVKYYKWQMRTITGGDDIIPSAVIGLTGIGRAEVIGGEVWLNGNKTGKSLAAWAPNTWENSNETEINKEENEFRFLMEPGRCVNLAFIAVGYSNLESIVSSRQICFKRKDKDLVLKNSTNNMLVWITNDKFEETTSENGNEKVLVRLTGKVTGATIGVLTDSDLCENYGSSSSFNYMTYIVNPSKTRWPSTREIRNRIQKPEGINFFIAPSPKIDIEMIDVNIKIIPEGFGNYSVPALLIWDSRYFNSDTSTYGIWRHVEENCGRSLENPTIERDIYKPQICPLTFGEGVKQKRSSMIALTDPFQFTLTTMNKLYVNTPPDIDIDVIATKEDTPIIDFQIPYHDDDSDSVHFYFPQNFSIGFVNLTLNGSLSYYPKQDFVGIDMINLTITDDAKNPYIVAKTIIINVTEENDMPVFGFIYNNSVFDVMKTKSLTLAFEGNKTSHNIFDFGFGDVDENENLSFLQSLTNLQDVTIKTTRTDTTMFLTNLFKNLNLKTSKEYSAEMVINKEFHGDFFYYIIGYDSQNFYTERLEIHIYILWSPCVYGVCSPKFNNSPPCDDVSRAASFDSFKCDCHPGYDGEWCETEINKDTCIGDNCVQYSAAVAAGIAVSVFLICIVLLTILWRCFKAKRQVYRLSSSERTSIHYSERINNSSDSDDDNQAISLNVLGRSNKSSDSDDDNQTMATNIFISIDDPVKERNVAPRAQYFRQSIEPLPLKKSKSSILPPIRGMKNKKCKEIQKGDPSSNDDSKFHLPEVHVHDIDKEREREIDDNPTRTPFFRDLTVLESHCQTLYSEGSGSVETGLSPLAIAKTASPSDLYIDQDNLTSCSPDTMQESMELHILNNRHRERRGQADSILRFQTSLRSPAPVDTRFEPSELQHINNKNIWGRRFTETEWSPSTSPLPRSPIDTRSGSMGGQRHGDKGSSPPTTPRSLSPDDKHLPFGYPHIGRRRCVDIGSSPPTSPRSGSPVYSRRYADTGLSPPMTPRSLSPVDAYFVGENTERFSPNILRIVSKDEVSHHSPSDSEDDGGSRNLTTTPIGSANEDPDFSNVNCD